MNIPERAAFELAVNDYASEVADAYDAEEHTADTPAPLIESSPSSTGSCGSGMNGRDTASAAVRLRPSPEVES